MKKIILLTFCILSMVLFNQSIEAASIVVSGTYQGKNLFVKNQFKPANSANCVTEIYVNGVKQTINLKAVDFEIDLSTLKIGDKVKIEIIHKEGCTPLVLNPQVIN